MGGGIGYEKRNVNLKHECFDLEYWGGLVYCEIWLGLGNLEIYVVLCVVSCVQTDSCLVGGDVDMVHGSCVTKL